MKKYYRQSRRRNNLQTVKRRKTNWISHILRRNGLLRHIIKGKIREIRSDGKTRKKT